MKYECGLAEIDRGKGWECPLGDPNETEIKECKDCAFARGREADHED